ncbi:MAG: beta-hydroxyacyl-ACP dehydratase [Tannerellaceae bacterium]|nr:beta-hydroxyacyl-ACP dehydratase [Tannerellaceae bacterium]
MQLENTYYRIIQVKSDGLSAVYRIAFLPGCEVYAGHFPGNPVCPGVCNIGTIKECAMKLTGQKLFISTIKQCRLTAIATPDGSPEVDIAITATLTATGFIITANITGAEKTYMQYRGEMTI